MVENLFKSVVLNSNIISNIDYYVNLRNLLQQECEHLPILLGESNETIIFESGIKIRKKYKRCLLCGNDVSFKKDAKLEFDARNFLKKENESFEDCNQKYLEALNLFQEICKQSDSEEEAFEIFNEKLNDSTYKKVLKKAK